MSPPASPPAALTIAGSDNSAGAGLQADLKTFTHFGVYGLTAVTCVVAEIPGRVSAIQPVELALVRQQIELSFAAFPVRAIKTGLLHSRAVIELVADWYAALPPNARPPLVVDPVMVATGGDPLLHSDAVAAYLDRLFPLATLLTPNLDEASVFAGAPLRSADEMRQAGPALAARFGTAVLLKGGHLRDGTALDLLCRPKGEPEEFAAPFTPGVSTHGTGCTLSAAITAGLALGLALSPAVAQAKRYVSAAIGQHFRWNHVDALRHWPEAAAAFCSLPEPDPAASSPP